MDNNEFKLRFGNNAVIDKEKYLEYSQIVEKEIFNNINDAKNKAIQIKLEDMNNFVSIFVKSGLNSPKYIIVSLKNREIAHNLFYEEAIDTSTLNILAEHYKNNKTRLQQWKDDVFARINSEEYQTIEEAKEKAKLTIKEDNDLTSIWEKNGKYYVVLSRDREQAFRNDYKELIKYNDLYSEIEMDENKNMDNKDIRITLKEYISNSLNDDIKLSFELYSKHFLPSVKPHTIFYKNEQINDEDKYKNIIDLIYNNMNNIKKLNMLNINSYKGGLQEVITIQIDSENYVLIGNTDNQEMKQLYDTIKNEIIKTIENNG